MAVVTRLTGLQPDVIRAWERRYGAVRPVRSRGNHRLYSDSDVRRLTLIRQALDLGWKVSQVAILDDEAIEELIREAGASAPTRSMKAEPSMAERALRQLPPDYQEILRLVREEDLTLRDCGARMGRSREAAKKLYGRALSSFTEMFERLQGDG